VCITAALVGVALSERAHTQPHGRPKSPSTNADQTIRLLARQNGLAKQRGALFRQLKTAASEEEAIEAIGDLRELLVEEDLFLPDSKT
jgi:hypothetical protein